MTSETVLHDSKLHVEEGGEAHAHDRVSLTTPCVVCERGAVAAPRSDTHEERSCEKLLSGSHGGS